MLANNTSIFNNICDAEKQVLQNKGVKKFIKSKKNFTSLEILYYNMLKELNVKYIPQYPLNGKYYDAYLPEHKVLLEFDGTFWHPTELKYATYNHQKKNFFNDRRKDKYASDHGLKIYRIREGSLINSDQLKTLIEKGVLN
jgi:very-short-patch-repair endonuclease